MAETPAADVITTLQNRINDLEAQLKTERDAREAAPKFERKDFDDAIAALKSEIAEMKREKAAVKKQEKEAKTGDNEEKSGGDDGDFGTVASGVRSLSIFGK